MKLFVKIAALWVLSISAACADRGSVADAPIVPLEKSGVAEEAYSATETATAMVNLNGRSRVDLSGKWRYIVDPSRLGILKAGRQRGFPKDRGPTNHPLIEYEWDTSPTMDVPGDWNSQVRELNMYEGMVWFRRKVSADPQPGKRYFLHFEASNYDTRVFLNGDLLGRHIGGFTPFEFEVTDKLKAGENSLVVSVDSEHSAKTIPAEDFDWQNYGGITRPVSLIEVPETFIHSYWVRLGKAGHIEVDVKLDGPNRAGSMVDISIPSLGVTVQAKTDAQGQAQASFPTPEGLKLWEPATPTLYDVKVASNQDSIGDRIGFRTIEVRGPKIYLNNKPLTLYGISIHEEALGEIPTRRMDEAAARALLGEALDLGSNFVRLAHYPHSEIMPRLADEMGLLVWSEIPVYWDIDFESEKTLHEAQTMINEMIARDKNRASIIVWSVANETPIKDVRTVFLRKLIDNVRAQDSTRLVSSAMDKSAKKDGQAENLIVANDPLGEFVDIISLNRYDGWYGPLTPAEIYKVQWETIYDKPIILSEFGAGALHGYRADPLTRWSEDYQALIYEEYIEMTKRIPNYAGMSPWILKDFRSHRRFHGRFQAGWNRKGLIDQTGKRKLAFDVLQNYYNEQGSREPLKP